MIMLLFSFVSALSLLADPILDLVYIRKVGPILVKTNHLWLRNAFLVVIGTCFLIPVYEAIIHSRSDGKLTLWHICKQYVKIMLRFEEFQLLRSFVSPLTKESVSKNWYYWILSHLEKQR